MGAVVGYNDGAEGIRPGVFVTGKRAVVKPRPRIPSARIFGNGLDNCFFDSMNDGLWTLEFSKPSYERGLFPFHIQPLKRTQAIGPGPLDWYVVFQGTMAACDDEMRKRLDALPPMPEKTEPTHVRAPRRKSAQPRPRKSRHPEREKMTPTIRYKVMQRDGGRCRMCGHSADDGARLHVDHIKPVSKGGKTVIENLQTLCDICNYGKGARQ